MDLYHLQEEAEPTNRTALESVVDYIKAEIDVRFSAYPMLAPSVSVSTPCRDCRDRFFSGVAPKSSGWHIDVLYLEAGRADAFVGCCHEFATINNHKCNRVQLLTKGGRSSTFLVYHSLPPVAHLASRV